MKWKKQGDYSAIGESGGYRISKTFHSGHALYTLWCGEKQVGMYDSMAAVNAAVANHKAKGAAQ